MRDKDVARLWGHVDRRGDDECWPWIKGNSANSPMISITCKTVSALRMMWEIWYNEVVPPGMSLLRTCGACRFECVNPKHMEVVKRGTTYKVWLAKQRVAEIAARPDIHTAAMMNGYKLVQGLIGTVCSSKSIGGSCG